MFLQGMLSVRVSRTKAGERRLMWAFTLLLPLTTTVALAVAMLDTLCVRFIWFRLLERGMLMDLSQRQPLYGVRMIWFLVTVTIGGYIILTILTI